MKTTTTFRMLATGLVALTSGFMLKAQITVTESDLAQTGHVYILAYDTLPTVAPGNAGASQTWNLSAIKHDYSDSLSFKNPSSLPGFSYFPSSNLACRDGGKPGAGASYDFYALNSNSFTALGQYAVVSPSIEVDTLNTAVTQFPLMYKNNWISHVRFIQTVPGSFRIVEKLTYYDTVDAWGNVTTPAGTFSSLRLKTISIAPYDSLFVWGGSSWTFVSVTYSGFVKEEGFSWYANGKGYPVASLYLDSLGGSKTASANYLAHSFANVDEVNNNSTAQAFPNPASSSVTIALNSTVQDGYVKIIDLTGREIETTPVKNGKVQLNTSAYAAGMYLYLITDREGNLVDKGKFCVNR